jgi:hypothetical protein
VTKVSKCDIQKVDNPKKRPVVQLGKVPQIMYIVSEFIHSIMHIYKVSHPFSIWSSVLHIRQSSVNFTTFDRAKVPYLEGKKAILA